MVIQNLEYLIHSEDMQNNVTSFPKFLIFFPGKKHL